MIKVDHKYDHKYLLKIKSLLLNVKNESVLISYFLGKTNRDRSVAMETSYLKKKQHCSQRF